VPSDATPGVHTITVSSSPLYPIPVAFTLTFEVIEDR
jgi:hypothetical protein